MGWAVRVHDARDLSVFHDVPAESLKDANEIVPLHKKPGVIVKVVRIEDGVEVEETDREELEMPKARREADLVLGPTPRKALKLCAKKGCKGTFVPNRARRLCDACRNAKDTPSVKRTTHQQSRSRTSSSPYDEVLADLLEKRAEAVRAVEQLDQAIAALERLCAA